MTDAISGLNHINMRAPEAMIERLRAFYCDVIGLREGPRPAFRSRGYWLYGGASDVLHLTIIAEENRDAVASIAPLPTGWLDHIAFTAVDKAAAIRRLESAGITYEIDEVPMAGPEVGQAQIFLTDPAGIGVELNFVQ